MFFLKFRVYHIHSYVSKASKKVFTLENSLYKHYVLKDRLCGQVARVPGHRYRGTGSISRTTFSER
jgi:hypothetical protein